MMEPSEEQIGVAAPVDRIVRGGVVTETGKYVLDERRHPDGNGGPLVGEYYGPYWGIHLNEVDGGEQIVMISDQGDGLSYHMAVKIRDFLNDSHEETTKVIPIDWESIESSISNCRGNVAARTNAINAMIADDAILNDIRQFLGLPRLKGWDIPCSRRSEIQEDV